MAPLPPTTERRRLRRRGGGVPASAPAPDGRDLQGWQRLSKRGPVTTNSHDHTLHENFKRDLKKKNSLILYIFKKTTSASGSEALISQ